MRMAGLDIAWRVKAPCRAAGADGILDLLLQSLA